MHFAGLNLFAIVLAAVVSFMFGWLWYGVLFPKHGWRLPARSEPSSRRRAGRAPTPFVITFVALSSWPGCWPASSATSGRGRSPCAAA